MQKNEFVCGDSDEGKRLDVFLSAALEQTRNHVQKLLDDGQVMVNQSARPKNYKLKPGDRVQVTVHEPIELEIVPQDIALDIVYEDDDIIVINKPKGMVVHPAPGHSENTLVNALLGHARDSLSGINGVIRPGIVHRIDKDTSGLLLVAKNDAAHVNLAQQLKAHAVKRQYQAIVMGTIKQDGTINLPIGRHQNDRKKMTVTQKNARHAVTHYCVLGYLDGYTHITCDLETGRTHQIRVHMAHIGHPIVGDKIYGNKSDRTGIDGQLLCAVKLEFTHPATGQAMCFAVEPPAYFMEFIERQNKKIKDKD